MSDMEDLGLFRQQFFFDAQDQLKESEQLIMDLESEPENKEKLDRLFRTFHTLKGNAGMVSEDLLNEACHSMESILEPIRKGQQKLSSDLIDQFLNAIDTLKQAVTQQDAKPFAPALEEIIRWKVKKSSHKALSVEQKKNTAAIFIAWPVFKAFLKVFFTFSSLAGKLKKNPDTQQAAAMLAEMAELSIDLRSRAADCSPAFGKSPLYIEKFMTLIFRENINYNPLSFELLEVLLASLSKKVFLQIRNDSLYQVEEIESIEKLKSLKEMPIPSEKLLCLRLNIPYQQLLRADNAFIMLNEVQQKFKGNIVILQQQDIKMEKISRVLSEIGEGSPKIYRSLYRAVYNLIGEDKP